MSRDTLLDTIRGGNWGAPQPAGRSGGTGTVTPYAAADPVPPASSRYGPWGGIAVQLRRRLRVLDLIDTQAMEGASFAYAVESGTFNAAETAELALKPQGDQVLTEAWVVAQTIAVYNKIQRQALADIPSLQQTMSNRLIYSVMRRVEDEIISGSGTANNLQGILATPGIGSITFSATEALSDLVLDGVTGILLAEAEPNGVIASPQDVATMLKLKASGSGERLDSDGAFSGTPDSMWGLPLITSTVMPAGTALVGDWSLGATLFIREGVHVLISDADQDDFIRNRATLLAESRVGLAVWQPKAFTLVHLA
jgi:HK97 family phage major capsid protein